MDMDTDTDIETGHCLSPPEVGAASTMVKLQMNLPASTRLPPPSQAAGGAAEEDEESLLGGPMPDTPPELKAAHAHSAPSGSIAPRGSRGGVLPPDPPEMLRSVSEPAFGHEAGEHLKKPEPAQKRYIRQFLARARFIVPVSTRKASRNRSLSVPLFHCGICLENESIDKGFFYSSCKFSDTHRYCKDCLGSYARVQIKEGITELKCPDPEACGGRATDAEVACLVDTETYQKYLTFKESKANPNMRVCATCSRHCYGSSDTPSMTCECGAQFCFTHDLAHPGVSCAVYASRVRKTELESDRLVKRITKKCPLCKADTIKNGGCNHMTCVSCKGNWCWICAREMGEGHYDATNLFGCPGGQFRHVPETPPCPCPCDCNLSVPLLLSVPFLRVGTFIALLCWMLSVFVIIALILCFVVIAGIPSLMVAAICLLFAYGWNLIGKVVPNESVRPFDVAVQAAYFAFIPLFSVCFFCLHLVWGAFAVSIMPIVFCFYYSQFPCFDRENSFMAEESFFFKYILFPVHLVFQVLPTRDDDD
jgi:hypothetical protein